MKQILIESRDYKPVIEQIPFNAPEEIIYFFKTGPRALVRVVPIWTKWNKKEGKDEEIWQFHITIVRFSFENKIESSNVQISNIPAIMKQHTGEMYEILDLVNNSEKRNNRTAEQFNEDFKSVLKNITKPK